MRSQTLQVYRTKYFDNFNDYRVVSFYQAMKRGTSLYISLLKLTLNSPCHFMKYVINL